MVRKKLTAELKDLPKKETGVAKGARRGFKNRKEATEEGGIRLTEGGQSIYKKTEVKFQTNVPSRRGRQKN